MYADLDIDPIVKDYNRELQKLPEHLRDRACPFKSFKMRGNAWEFRDAEGVLLNPPPITVTPTRVGKSPAKQLSAGMTKSERSLLLTVVGRVKELHDAFNELTEVLADRFKQIEADQVSKSLDSEAYDSIAEISERLDRLESSLEEIAENGLRYRGYWQEGVKAKRGDAYTHNGSLWWAVRNTADKPCNESVDWQVAVRKGRDAK
jgi:hypothetical protein